MRYCGVMHSENKSIWTFKFTKAETRAITGGKDFKECATAQVSYCEGDFDVSVLVICDDTPITSAVYPVLNFYAFCEYVKDIVKLHYKHTAKLVYAVWREE